MSRSNDVKDLPKIQTESKQTLTTGLDFNLSEIQDYANFSRLTYYSREKILEESLSGWQLASLVTKVGDRVHIYTKSNSNKVIIAFKGTDQTRDFYSDFKLAQGKYEKLPEELGHFLTEYLRHLDYIENPQRELIFVGHSLGGYLATRYMIQFSKKYPNAKLFIFDAPGLDPNCDIREAASLKCRMHNFVNKPNLINTLGIQVCNMHLIVNDANLQTDYKEVSEFLWQGFLNDCATYLGEFLWDQRGVVIEATAGLLVDGLKSMGIQIDREKLINIINGFHQFLGKQKDRAEEKLNFADRQKKIEIMLNTHMIERLYKMLITSKTRIISVPKGEFPSFNDYLTKAIKDLDCEYDRQSQLPERQLTCATSSLFLPLKVQSQPIANKMIKKYYLSSFLPVIAFAVVLTQERLRDPMPLLLSFLLVVISTTLLYNNSKEKSLIKICDRKEQLLNSRRKFLQSFVLDRIHSKDEKFGNWTSTGINQLRKLFPQNYILKLEDCAEVAQQICEIISARLAGNEDRDIQSAALYAGVLHVLTAFERQLQELSAEEESLQDGSILGSSYYPRLR